VSAVTGLWRRNSHRRGDALRNRLHLAVGLGLAMGLALSAALAAAAESPANTLYVDRANPSCSNTGQGAGTITKPFCTIGAAAAKATGGWTVLVSAGTYNEQVSVKSGSVGAPIVFRPEDGETVTVTGPQYGFYVSNRSWVTIRGFKVTDTGNDGMHISSGSRNVEVVGNEVNSAGDPSAQTAEGISVTDASDVLLADNVVHHNSKYGIYLANSTRIEIVENELFSNAKVTSRSASGIRLHSSIANTIDSNVTHANEDSGIEIVTGSNDNLVVNNVTYDNGDHGVDVLASLRNRIVSNTVYRNVTAGINAEGSSTGTTIANNISVDNGIASPRTRGNIRVDSNSISGTTIDYDLIHLTTPDIMVVWGATSYTSLAAFRAGTGQEANGTQGDPKWVNASIGDFHLLAGSPAIDAANSGVSGHPSTDVEGTARVDDPVTANTGAGPRTYDDRGAYERVGAAVDHIVVSPASASIAAGGSQAYTAEAFDASNASLGDVTSSTVFSIAPNGSCTGASCGATAAGGHTVTANHAGKTATAALTVTPGPVDQIVLSPASASIEAGGSQAYATEGRDRYGNSLGDLTSSTAFTIGPDGSCAGASCGASAAGAHTVTASHAGKTATAALTVTPGPLDEIVLSPASASIEAGGSQAYTAEARDQYGNSRGDVTSSTVFGIAPDGACDGTSCGATETGAHTVTGSHAGKSATADLLVLSPTGVDHIVVNPASASIGAGGSQAYTAEAFDASNASLGDVTSSTVFSIAPDGSCAGASCGATAAGGHTVTGSHAGKSATAVLTVTAGALDHIVLSPASASIAAGGSQAYTTEGVDQYGNSLGDVTSSTSFSIAPDGSCAGATCGGTEAGAHTVTGSHGGKSATAALTVTAGTLDHIVLSPASATITVGGSQVYTAEGRDQAGNSLGDVTASTAFTIAPNGSCSGSVCTPPAGGSYTITGTNQGKTATAILTVDYVRNPGFEVDLSGWNTSSSGAGVTLTRVVDTLTGSWVAKLANTGTTPVTANLQDSPNWVAATSGGTYTGAIWARADTSGARIKLRFREYNGGVLAGSASAEADLTASWQNVTVSYAAGAPGSTLDFQAYVTNAPAGTVFYADNVSIVRAG
jgi:parallel beta-helix repeat protein